MEGKPFSLQEGKIYIFFFDPSCLHCLNAARKMATMNWGDTKIVVVPSVTPQYAHQFLQDARLTAGVSYDLDLLKKTFPYVSTPAAVAIEDGREKAEDLPVRRRRARSDAEEDPLHLLNETGLVVTARRLGPGGPDG